MKQTKQTAASAIQNAISLAEALKLNSVSELLPEILNRAQQQNISYTQLVSEILKKELDARLEKSVVRSLKRSKIGTVEDLDTFDFSIRPQLHQSFSLQIQASVAGKRFFQQRLRLQQLLTDW